MRSAPILLLAMALCADLALAQRRRNQGGGGGGNRRVGGGGGNRNRVNNQGEVKGTYKAESYHVFWFSATSPRLPDCERPQGERPVHLPLHLERHQLQWLPDRLGGRDQAVVLNKVRTD